MDHPNPIDPNASTKPKININLKFTQAQKKREEKRESNTLQPAKTPLLPDPVRAPEDTQSENKTAFLKSLENKIREEKTRSSQAAKRKMLKGEPILTLHDRKPVARNNVDQNNNKGHPINTIQRSIPPTKIKKQNPKRGYQQVQQNHGLLNAPQMYGQQQAQTYMQVDPGFVQPQWPMQGVPPAVMMEPNPYIGVPTMGFNELNPLPYQQRLHITQPPPVAIQQQFETPFTVDTREVIMNPNKRKMTINVKNDMFPKKTNTNNTDNERYLSTIDRPEIRNSDNGLVKIWRTKWPWLKKFEVTHTVNSDTPNKNQFLKLDFEWVKVLVTGYPESMGREELLNILIDIVREKMIPCFIEFNSKECKFFLHERLPVAFRNKNLFFEHNGHCILITVVYIQIDETNTLDLNPDDLISTWLINRCEANKLDLSNFIPKDKSYIMYLPLSVTWNQKFLIECFDKTIVWNAVTYINLSYNNIKCIIKFNLPKMTPRLKTLDLSHNDIETISSLNCIQKLELKGLVLEGNPLCWNHLDKDNYIHVVRLMFPTLNYLDNIEISVKDFPIEVKNFSVDARSTPLVDKFLEMYFSLIDTYDERQYLEGLYSDNAVMTMTCDIEMKRDPKFEPLQSMYNMCLTKSLQLSKDVGCLRGGQKIVKKITKWPVIQHDPQSFSVDVVMHTEYQTVLTVYGIFRIPTEALNKQEPWVKFMRTFVLYTTNGVEYKITNDMLNLMRANESLSQHVYTQKTRSISLKIEKPSDEIKEKLVDIFMKVTNSSKKTCETCLGMRGWHLKDALEYYLTLQT